MSTSPLLESKWTWALLPVSLVVAALAFVIATSVSEPRMRELEWLRSVPRADPAAPTDQPARYTGKLHGPEGRATPAGERAAAYWWAVVHRDDETDDTVYCQGRDRSLLVLETPSGSIPLAFTEAETQHVGLMDDVKDNEYDLPIAIDLGNTERSYSEVFPPGTCDGHGARYEQSLFPEGAGVEVVGCMKAGAIDLCDEALPLRAVLSMTDLETHRRHRADKAKFPFRAGLAATAVALLLAGLSFAAKASREMLGARDEEGEQP